MAKEFVPAPTPAPESAAQVFPHSETVPMVFPHKVILTLNANTRVIFEPGIQQVPVELQDHFWLNNNNVKGWKPQAPREGAITQAIMDNLIKQGYKVGSLDEAQVVYDAMPDAMRKALEPEPKKPAKGGKPALEE